MVMERLSRLPRKLMPRILKGFTRKQATMTVSETLKASGIYQYWPGFLIVVSEKATMQTP